MVKIIFVAIALLTSAVAAEAQTTISALPAATTPLAGTEIAPIVQSGATKKAPASAFVNLPTVPFTGLTFNKLTLTQPATGSTLTVANGKTATVNNTLTLTAVDGSTLAIGAGGTLGSNAYTSTPYAPIASPTFTGVVTMPVAVGTSLALGGGSIGSDALETTGTTTHNGAVSIISSSLTVSGNQAVPAWLTSGVRYKGVAGTLTDTTSSGTVAAAYTNVFGGGSTIAASSPATFTNYFGSYFNDPVAGTNVTLTNKWALGADSAKFGTSNQVTISTTGVITAASPSFTTPSLGVATATSINKVAITAPSTGSTLTIADGKTLTASNTLTFTGTDSSSVAFGTGGTVTYTIAHGSSALNTNAIGSTACDTTTVSATNVLSTDVVTASFNGATVGVTGYAPLTTGGLSIRPYPTSGNVNFEVCNGTALSITPGALTLNWGVRR